MSINDVIELLGGIALFLYGMTIMGAGLEKIAGGKMQGILQKLTASPVKGLLLGTFITAIIQSSAGTVVIVIGLVNSGIMALPAAVGVIMGANIGTTVTGQIISLSDLSGSGWLSMLKPTTFAPLVAFVGTLLYVFVKAPKKRNYGQILLGFGILFIGMSMMDTAVAPLKESTWFVQLFTNLSNPVIGLLVGLLATVLIQSSSASVGILQALTSTGLVTFGSAFPVILGTHVGTAFTPLLACSGASRDSKRSAVIHLLFNVLGSALFLVVFCLADLLLQPAFFGVVLSKSNVANIHTFSSVLAALLLLPTGPLLIRMSRAIVPDKTGADSQDLELPVLDQRLFSTPSVAIQQARSAVAKMSERADHNFRKAMQVLSRFSDEEFSNIDQREEVLDRMEVTVSDYLIAVSDEDLTERESQQVNLLIKCVTDFERIGDHAVNIAQRGAEMRDKELTFSAEAWKELQVMEQAVAEIIAMANLAFAENDLAKALEVEPLEETVDLMCDALRTRHIQRLKDGVCQIEPGIIFLDLLTDIERISDHCSNVAARIISAESEEELDVHTLKQNLHSGNALQFNSLLDDYKQKYYSRLDEIAAEAQ